MKPVVKCTKINFDYLRYSGGKIQFPSKLGICDYALYLKAALLDDLLILPILYDQRIRKLNTVFAFCEKLRLS